MAIHPTAVIDPGARLGDGVEVGAYSIVGPDGRVLAESESLELNRDLTYDNSQLLAKGAEEQLLYRDMEDSAARRILRRLQALGGDT